MVFENTQDPIIDEATFEAVQKIRRKVRRYPDGWGEVHPLTGLMYCADCSAKMYVHRAHNGKRTAHYTCSSYTKVPCGTLCSSAHYIHEDNVMELIRELLREIAADARMDKEEFIRIIQESQERQGTLDINKKKAELAKAGSRSGELEKLICRIYEDNILGRLPDERYQILSTQYEAEKARIEEQITQHHKPGRGNHFERTDLCVGGENMIYKIEYAEGQCCNFANSSKDLITWLKLLKDERITDIRKLYKSGVSDSVLEKYQQYLSK